MAKTLNVNKNLFGEMHILRANRLSTSAKNHDFSSVVIFLLSK